MIEFDSRTTVLQGNQAIEQMSSRYIGGRKDDVVLGLNLRQEMSLRMDASASNWEIPSRYVQWV